MDIYIYMCLCTCSITKNLRRFKFFFKKRCHFHMKGENHVEIKKFDDGH